MKKRLPNGCSCSQPAVHPKTWERGNTSVKKPWYIQYRFYDPKFKEKYPGGFQTMFKGMNTYQILIERQEATRELLDELNILLSKGYNPILGSIIEVEPEPMEDSPDYVIHPDTPFITAMEKGLKRLDIVPEFRQDIESNLRFVKTAAEQLRLDIKPIKDIRRRHIIMILDRCGKNKEIWTEATYNRYRRNLSCVFTELVKVEAMENTPIDKFLSQKKETKAEQEVLTPDEIKLINIELRAQNFPFWRFIHIFCNSGARTSEIMKVKKKDVDLRRQMIKYTIKKGAFIRKVERPIKTVVLHFWQQLMIEANELDNEAFIFSTGLRPGEHEIRKDQISRRWQLWGQKKLGIKKKWYRFKHLNTDMMDELYDAEIAAKLNQHDVSMVTTVYAVGRRKRQNEIIKKSPNALGSV